MPEPVDQSGHRQLTLDLAHKLFPLTERLQRNILRSLGKFNPKLRTQVQAELERLRTRL